MAMSALLAGADIWSTGAFAMESPLKDLLDSDNFTLEQLLAEDELLQEIRGVHPKLIDFLGTEEIVTRLVQYIALSPNKEDTPQWLKDLRNDTAAQFSDDQIHIRFPYVCCEVICCEVPNFLETLIDGKVKEDPSILEDENSVEVVAPKRILTLFVNSILSYQGRLDDYRAGYLEKILTLLVRTKPQIMVDFFNQHKDLLQDMVRHIYSHSIMQIVQRLLLPKRPIPQPEDGEQDEEGLITSAADETPFHCSWSEDPASLNLLLDALEDEDCSLNASEVLATIVQNSLLSSETMLTLTSTDSLQRIIADCVTVQDTFSPHESLMTSAMNVLESIILQLGGYGSVGTMTLVPEEGMDLPHEHLIADLDNLVELLPGLLDSLSGLLRHEDTKEWTSMMQFSKTDPQQLLGTARLRIVRVLEALVLLGDACVDRCLVQSDCLGLCLDLFWEFQWCSMLHQSVANLLVHAFEGVLRYDMQDYFINRCRLLTRLMDSFHADRSQATTKELTPTAVDSEPLPVSEDDVDAVLEQQEGSDQVVDAPGLDQGASSMHSTATSNAESAVAQSFRLGYMGHVIIICQALVQAYTAEDMDGKENVQTEEGQPQQPELCDLWEVVSTCEQSEQWFKFVATTLSTETAIQTMPLGGFVAGSNDPLHAHRPEPEDGEDFDMSAPMPPRGILGDGELLDMDDNELDIAASMISGLSLSKPSEGGGDDDAQSGSAGSGDSEKSYNSGETNRSEGGYLFDDPLGKLGSGLGIELGKLTKYKPGDDANAEAQPVGTTSDDDDDYHNSSSDEEPDHGRSDSGDVPVMDLFAGNFDVSDGGAKPAMDAPTEEFANFADAFSDQPPADEEFGAFESAKPVEGDGAAGDSTQGSSSEIDELFGEGDHSALLEVDDPSDHEGTTAAPVDILGDTSDDSLSAVPLHRPEPEALSPSSDLRPESPVIPPTTSTDGVLLDENKSSTMSFVDNAEPAPSFDESKVVDEGDTTVDESTASEGAASTPYPSPAEEPIAIDPIATSSEESDVVGDLPVGDLPVLDSVPSPNKAASPSNGEAPLSPGSVKAAPSDELFADMAKKVEEESSTASSS